MPKNTRWDRNLSVTPDAQGLIGHAGAVLLRKLADQCGLTSALGAALGRTGKFPLIDRGMALVSMAVAIALGARSMSGRRMAVVHRGLAGDRCLRRSLRVGPGGRGTEPGGAVRGVAGQLPDGGGRFHRRAVRPAHLRLPGKQGHHEMHHHF